MKISDILSYHKDNEKIAIKYREKTISYKKLYKTCIELSFFLKKFSNIMSNNIGIFLPNSLDYAISYFTIAMMEKVITPIGVHAKEKEILSTIDYCDLNFILTNSENKILIKKEMKNIISKVFLFCIDTCEIEIIGTVENKNLNKKIKSEIDENDVALMLHTSGTTSNPKRVMLSHKNLLSNIKSNIESLGFRENDKVLIALPMFFGYCNTAQFLTHLYLGATIVIMHGFFLPNLFFKLIEKEKITNFTGVPTMLLSLLSFKNRKKYDTSSLRFICFGGGKFPLLKLEKLIDEFPKIGFIQTYGQTEAAPRVTALLAQFSKTKIGSIGRPIPNVTLEIFNESNERVNIGETGEIVVSGENVMLGYYKRPNETSKVIKNGYLYTGDLGYFDEDGFIYLNGRKKNMIISGGINIYPEEIEEILSLYPKIQDVVVVKEEDELLGEIPVAKVVLNNGNSVDEEEILNFASLNLANFKIPKKIYFVKELEKTSTGKIKRKVDK